VEIGKLISAIEETLTYLRNSQSSCYTDTSVEDIVEQLESELGKAKSSRAVDAKLISLLFAPTGAIQDTAIENGWGKEFIKIADIIDLYTNR
jgi:hypothetical protein